MSTDKKIDENIYGAASIDHPNRIAFVLLNEKVYSSENISHAKLLENLGLNEEEIRNHLESIPRAVFYTDTNEFFVYQGLDFRQPDNLEDTLTIYLSKEVSRYINPATIVGLGLIKGFYGDKWKPQIIIKR